MINSHSQSQEIDKFTEVVLGKTYDALYQAQNLRIQLGTFFGTVNLAALGIAFGSRIATIVIFAGILLWVFVLLDIFMRRAIAVFCLQLVRLWHSNKPDDRESYRELMSILGGPGAEKIVEISGLPTWQQRTKLINQLPMRNPTFVGFYLPLLAGLAEIVMGFALVWYSNWSFA